LPFPGEKLKSGVMMKADYLWNNDIGIPANFDFYAGSIAGQSFVGNLYPDLGILVGDRWHWSTFWAMNLQLAAGTGFGSTFRLSIKLEDQCSKLN
jgi:hypothetical protein